jgi:hypothetical protein
VKFWQKITCLVSGQRSSVCLQMRLTGEPPCNAAEELVKKLSGSRLELPVDWLEKRIAHELYAEELRLTRHTAEIGLHGRAFFRKEAGVILAKIRPEFGRIREAVAGQEAEDTGGTFTN